MSPEKLRFSRLKWRMVGWIVVVGASLCLNVTAVLYYRIPHRLWKSEEYWSPQNVHEVRLSGSCEACHLNGRPAEPVLRFRDELQTLPQVKDWQGSGRSKLSELLRIQGVRPAPNVKRVSSIHHESIRCETLVFSQADGVEVPAFLLRANTPEPQPAVIVVPGHGGGIIDSAGFEEDFQHSIGLELAKRGFAVLTMEPRGFGYLRKIGKPSQEMDYWPYLGFLLAQGDSWMGVCVRDVMAGLDYLVTDSTIDSQRIGVYGISSGGGVASYLMALDERIKAGIISCYVQSFEAMFSYSLQGPAVAVPSIRNYMDVGDCLGLAAPRPMLVHWGELDTDRSSRCASLNDTSSTMVLSAKKVYGRFGKPEMLEAVVSPGIKHEADVEIAVQFFSRTLQEQ